MTPETEALLYECRTALLQYSDEQLDALLAHWFAFMIGEETRDEELDDLCLLLDYRVQSWGAKTFYGTYTAWWEVEGYLVPEGGIFSCANVQSLRQRLLNMPAEQFGLVMELAYQARLMEVRLQGESSLLTGNGFLRQLIAWLGDIASKFEYIQQRNLLGLHLSLETKEQRRTREQEAIARASQQGYLIIYPSTTRLVKEAFRHWCAVNERPSISVEVTGLRLAKVLINTKTLGTWSSIEAARVYDRLMACAEPYISRSRMQQHQAALNQVFRRLVVLEEVLAEDAEQVAQDFVALWSEILEEERQHISQRKERLAALAEPQWMIALRGMHAQENEPTSPLPPLPEKVVLPDQWASLLTKEQLCAFLAFLELPTRSRDAKTALVERLLERIQTDQTSKAQFFEVFVVELAVPPWELEELFACTSTERKRWVEEGKLSVLDYRSFRKAGSEKMYPIFDRRVILSLSREELEAWRTEHQSHVHERRKAGAQAAAASRKAKLQSST
jgi:hypothetical protein